MRSVDKELLLGVVICVVTLLLTGCGETLRGMGKDVNRVGRGVKTIFISD